MTTEVLSSAPIYTIAGTGPYAVPHEYQAADEFEVSVLLDDTVTVLASNLYTITPAGPAISGNLTLEAAIAVSYADEQLLIRRATRVEQGWQGINGSREKGMEVQLDRTVQALQDTRLDGAASLKRSPFDSWSPVLPAIEPNRAIVAAGDGTGLVFGPTVDEISNAQASALLAQEWADGDTEPGGAGTKSARIWAEKTALATGAAIEAQVATEALLNATGPVFESRAAFAAAEIPAGVNTWTIIHPPWPAVNSVRCVYQRDPTGTSGASANFVKGKPMGIAYPQHWGAMGDWTSGTNGTDDTAALLAWVTFLNSERCIAGVDGKYRYNAPLIFTAFGQKFATLGVSGSQFIATHAAGPAIQVRKSFSEVTEMTVHSEGARKTAPYDVMSPGILVGDLDWENPTVDNGPSAAFVNVDKCICTFHPGSGVLKFGPGGGVDNNIITDNRGHGIDMEYGSEISVLSAVLGFPGWVSSFHSNKIERSGGHSICAGSPTSSAGENIYRLSVVNNDSQHNGLNAALRYTNHQYYLVGEQIETNRNVANCALGGATGGMFVAGRQQYHIANRFVDLGSEAYFVGNLASYPTRGIHIRELRVSNTEPDLNPAVVVDATIAKLNNVTVQSSDPSNITSLIDEDDRAKYTWLDDEGVNDFAELRHGNKLVLTEEPVESFTPAVVFTTPGDSAFNYGIVGGKQLGRIIKKSSNRIRVEIELVFNCTHTTAAGVMIIEALGLPDLGFTFDADRKQPLTISTLQNIAIGTGYQITCYTNATDNFRLVQLVSGNNAPVAVGPTHIVSGATTAIVVAGEIEVLP